MLGRGKLAVVRRLPGLQLVDGGPQRLSRLSRIPGLSAGLLEVSPLPDRQLVNRSLERLGDLHRFLGYVTRANRIALGLGDLR